MSGAIVNVPLLSIAAVSREEDRAWEAAARLNRWLGLGRRDDDALRRIAAARSSGLRVAARAELARRRRLSR